MNTCTKVFLRKRPYAGGKLSLYLDYYPAIRNPHTNKMTRRETLGIVIFANPTNEMQRRRLEVYTINFSCTSLIYPVRNY